MRLPELGVGVVYNPGLESLLEAGHDLVDVIEVEPQTFWMQTGLAEAVYRVDQRVLERLAAYRQPKIVHGVGFPVAGTNSTLDAQVQPFVNTITALHAPWASEHLSFNRFRSASGEKSAGFLLPPLQTTEGAELAVANIRRLKHALPVPFAFETGVNYLQRRPGELSDGEFFAAVAEGADCGILLDLHNLWTNERNGRQSVMDALAAIPLERVWEVHVAGGDSLDGYWLDAHSDLVPVPVMELLAEVLPRLPNLKAVVFEIMEDYIEVRGITTVQLVEQMAALQELWRSRCVRPDRSIAPSRPGRGSENERACADSARNWEEALGELVIGHRCDSPLARSLAQDPAIGVYRRLVSSVRAGMAVSVLRLSYRMLVLHLGEERVQTMFESFWARVSPEPFPSDEARNFAAHVGAQSFEIPHLDEVLAFELATHNAALMQTAQTVRFSCDPIPLLTALGEGRLPDQTAGMGVLMTIEP
jgi:uncharacterized protein (UPF0276 family)